MNLPKPTSLRYNELLNKIETGKLKIPQFQRDFVWDLQKSAKLLDSIIKGYPIGTLIIWKTDVRLKMIGELGHLVLREPEPNEKVEYVLDGQQRITTLFVALRGEKIGKTDYSEIYVNLEASQEDEIIITDVSDKDISTYIRFKDLLSSSHSDIYRQFREEESKIDLISEYKTNVSTYDFSVIEVADAPIEVATDIFTRINVGGKPLTVFEIMCAKIYDKASMFDLSDKFDDFIESITSIKYDTIPQVMPLQLIALILRKNCKGSTILNLKKEEVIDNWDNAIIALKCAIDFVRASFGVQSSKLLPYDVLLIPIAYYIYKAKCTSPTGEHAKYLTDMFWRYAIMQRYNNATESKLASDIVLIDTIINGGDYKPAISVDLSEKYLRENGSFRIGKCITKAIVCLLLSQNPMRLDSANHKVLTDDKELVKGNGKNYHHFFPRALMRKKGFEDDVVDNIVNIIVVDDYTNKYKIKDRAPSDYISEFSKINPQIGSALASHLIGDIEIYGIKSDNFNEFYSKRAEWIAQELSKYLCLDIEVEPDAEEDMEAMDISAKEAYSALWSMLNEVTKKEGSPISINVVSTSRIQNSNIIPAKLDLRFVASSQYQRIGIELVFRDEAVYTQLITQKNEFESLCGIKGLVWSDQTVKTKRIILDYPRKTNVYEKSKYEKYVLWFIKNGADLKEAIELFAEDMNIGKGIAPEIVDKPEIVFCKAKGILASAFYHGKSNGFEVLKQSSVKLSTKAYGAAQKKRDELVRSGVIKQIGDGKGEFTQDYKFSTPSQAADVILGGSNNGWIVWKNASGEKTLDSMYRNVAR